MTNCLSVPMGTVIASGAIPGGEKEGRRSSTTNDEAATPSGNFPCQSAGSLRGKGFFNAPSTCGRSSSGTMCDESPLSVRASKRTGSSKGNPFSTKSPSSPENSACVHCSPPSGSFQKARTDPDEWLVCEGYSTFPRTALPEGARRRNQLAPE